MRANLIAIFISFFSFINSHSNVHFPIPFNKHIQDSELIIDALFLSEVSTEDNGWYEGSFKVLQSVGMNNNTIDNNFVLKVRYQKDANSFNYYQVDFDEGERVVLFLKNDYNKFVLTHGPKSKYSVMKKNRKWIMISEVFPLNPILGKIQLTEFLDLVEKTKKTKVFVNNEDPSLAVYKKNISFLRKPLSNRSIASIQSNNSEAVTDNSQQISIFWLIIIFIVLTGISRYIFSKNNARS